MRPTEAIGPDRPPPSGGRRVLFLDDDAERAAAFLAAYPDAVWVRSASDCLALLEGPWDEVHLDHDLGGEAFVDMDRDDCGMAVVRWLCEAPRLHLTTARFVVHTHNSYAACVMLLHLREMGFDAEAIPFSRRGVGTRPAEGVGLFDRLAGWLRRGPAGPRVPTRS